MPEPIIVHDSDSEPEDLHRLKRQKISRDRSGIIDLRGESSMEIDNTAAQTFLNASSKNSALKGRKRFTADLNDAKEATKQPVVLHGIQVKRIHPGEDEGAIEVVIAKAGGEHVLSLSLLVSDTSDYPKSHTFFSYALDSDVPSKIQEIIEDIASQPSRCISDAVEKLCSKVAKAVGVVSLQHEPSQSQEIEMEDDEGSDDDYEAFEVFEDSGSANSKTKIAKLQRDFIDTVATGYRPGIIRFGGDDFCLSVSLPVTTLAQSIPPRALMAWDRRLLSRSQHLCLLICGTRGVYPPVRCDGIYTSSDVHLSFKVGLCGRYKPGVINAREASRVHGLILKDAEDELRMQAEKAAEERAAMYDMLDEDNDGVPPPAEVHEEREEEDEGRFDKFSLSSSLESLMDQAFLKVLQFRRQFGLGWAGAEILLAEVEKSQRKPEEIYRAQKTNLVAADKAEGMLIETNDLPHDPLHNLGLGEDINLPLTAFCYLVRRLTLCTRFCIVCHNRITSEFEALKPYVCDSKLCQYQYYSLNRGPSLEYEIIHNPQTVDLLISITYAAAAEGVIDDPLPIGMGLRVPKPDPSRIPAPPPLPSVIMNAAGQPVAAPPQAVQPLRPAFVGNDGLCEFDDLSLHEMRASIVSLIDSLPSIDDMRKHLLRRVKPGKSKPRLVECDPEGLPAAWKLLRWCVGSCTAYLEEISSREEKIGNIDPLWRQYRFSVGAPDAEAKFKAAVQEAQAVSENAVRFPSLYAFHGSPLRNWHSIIRHGLWFKTVTHGRAYGHGVYLAKEGSVSMGHYAGGNRVAGWRRSKVSPTSCVALTEVVNLPEKFVSNNPYFVIKDTHWIVCRYLLVKGASPDPLEAGYDVGSSKKARKKDDKIPFVKLDPSHPITLSGTAIEIPEPSYQIEKLLEARRSEMFEEEPDSEDQTVFNYVDAGDAAEEPIVVDDSDEEMHDYSSPAPAPASGPSTSKLKTRPANDWKHDPKWVSDTVSNLMPPPIESTPSATMAVQRELRAMLKEQETCSSLSELGWYMPPDLIGDNLFQWIVEMHSFDPELPIAKDMKAKNVNSIIFEIRFPPAFPLSPPFFRIITPRFLPFIHGGGGHVTGGGSICMDLLTADGWLPSYSISAVLMQIRLAISNLEPKPARLANNWNQHYGVGESLVGFKRAAATHGWQLPIGIDALVRD